MTPERYWPSVYGGVFCRLFGWIGHDWIEVVVGSSGGEIIAGQQCRRCYRTRDCECKVCLQLIDGQERSAPDGSEAL